MLLFIYSLFVAVFLFGSLNFAYKRTNHYRSSLEAIQKFIDGVPFELEIVNTGSSYASYAYDYSNTELKGFNFALQPQSLSYDFKILKHYVSHLKKGCVVQIVLADFIFCFLDYADDRRNYRYYHFLNSCDILNYSTLKSFIIKQIPLFQGKIHLRSLIRDIPSSNIFAQDCNYLSEVSVVAEASARINGWVKEFGLKNTSDTELPEELLLMFKSTTNLVDQIIRYCIDNGLKPLLVIPPTSAVLNNLLSKEFIKKVLYDNIEKSNNQNIPVLDYLYDERFQDYSLYVNSDMLNRTGREKFIKVVIADLQALKLI